MEKGIEYGRRKIEGGKYGEKNRVWREVWRKE